MAHRLGARLGEELGAIRHRRRTAPAPAANQRETLCPLTRRRLYTLLVGSPAEVAINQLLYAKMPYDPAKDLVAVARVASAPLVLVVNARSPAHSVADLPAPDQGQGGTANYASSGTGGRSIWPANGSGWSPGRASPISR